MLQISRQIEKIRSNYHMPFTMQSLMAFILQHDGYYDSFVNFNPKMNVISILDVLSWRGTVPQEPRVRQGEHQCRDAAVFWIESTKISDYGSGIVIQWRGR